MTYVQLTEALTFGKCSGVKPIEIIQSGNQTNIRYLLWLREQRDGFNLKYSFDADLNHTLDALVRGDKASYGGYAVRYDDTAYQVWKSEKRLQIKRRKEQKIREQAALLAAQIEEAKRQERIAREEAEIAKLREEAEAKVLNERKVNYGSSWGGW